MATEKETIIIDLKVDQGSAITELEKTKKVIIGVKEEQQQLTKAYKAGEVAVDEYASESVRLEGILKKSQSEYNNIQKSLTGVKTQMDKLIDSNKKISSEFQNAASSIKVAGVSVNDLSSKLTAFANPAVAAIGFVTALGAAYANSTVGAKDLSFASNQLSSAMNLLINDFGRLVSSAEDGEGLISKGTNFLIESFGNYLARGFGSKLASESKQLALIQEQLEDLQREEISVRSAGADRLGDNQEMLTTIGLEQTKLNEKVHLYGEIIANISKNEDELIDIKKRQLSFVEEQLSKNKEDEILQTAVLNIKREIANIEKDAERKRQAVQRQEDNLLDTENKKALALKKQADETERKINAQNDASDRELRNRQVTFNDDPKAKQFDPQEQFEKDQELINADLGLVKTSEEQKRDELLRTNAIKQMIADEDRARFQENAQLMEDNFNTLAGLFSQGSEARKLFALAGIGADTASAIASLTAASEANPANAFTFGGAGAAQFAAGLVRILANIVAAKEFLSGEFAGGGQFVTKGPAFIMVGDNPGGRERVTVEPLSGKGQTRTRGNRIAMAGGGSLTTGFDDGGIMKMGATAQMDQALALTNAMKNLPIPEVSVVEINRVQQMVKVKQSVASA